MNKNISIITFYPCGGNTIFKKELTQISNSSKTKVMFLKHNKYGYFCASIFGGIFVGLGVYLIYTIGSLLNNANYSVIIMGMSFGITLSLVIMAGAELFTGNNMVMMIGICCKKITWLDAVKLLGICYLGNWCGAILLACIFHYSHLISDDLARFIALSAYTKTHLAFYSLFFKGLFCNILMCLAVWCSYRCASETAKLIMIFWCLFAFIVSGFENSIANMTLLSIGLLNPVDFNITVLGYFYNILTVTFGNICGGAFFVGLPYFIIANKSDEN